MTGDFSDKVFMTINSGSVLSGNTMSEKPVNTYYMYKLCDISGNESCMKNAHDIEKLLMDDKMSKILKSVKIAERMSRLQLRAICLMLRVPALCTSSLAAR